MQKVLRVYRQLKIATRITNELIMTKQNYNPKTKINYNLLLSKLDENKIAAIELPSNDMLPFIQFLGKQKYESKLYFELNKGKVIITKNKTK